jgi:hypothetical protein
MAGVDFVFNIALGKVAEYAARVNANDPTNSALIIVVLEATGLEADGTLKNYDTLSALTGGGSSEPEQAQYARKTLDNTGGITITVTDGSDKVEVDCPDQTWSAVVAGDSWSKLLVCYDPDTTTGTDTTVIPLVGLDIDVVPDGNDIVWQPNASGFYRATDTSA